MRRRDFILIRYQPLLLRYKDVQADVPLGALAGLERDHAGVGLAPLFAERVAEVVLVLDGDKLLGGRGVHLEGFDLGRKSDDVDAIVRGRIDDLHSYLIVLPDEVVPVVVKELRAQRFSVGRTQVVASAIDGDDFAGRKDVVVTVDFGGGNLDIDTFEDFRKLSGESE